MEIEIIYNQLKSALGREIEENQLAGEKIEVICRSLTSKEAIGTPEHDDYPIIKGKEVMIEATFRGVAGQAFTDEFENRTFPVEDLLAFDHSKPAARASFIAGLNAVYRYLERCEKTVHCRNEEPVDCARELATISDFQNKKILLVGLQPRFLEYLKKQNRVRVLDLDPDNVNHERFGITIESGDDPREGIAWCDLVFATGSTIVNGSITNFLNCGKPTVFFGVTISAAASILNLRSYCHCGH